MMEALLTIVAIIGMMALAVILGIIMGLTHIIIKSFGEVKENKKENKLD